MNSLHLDTAISKSGLDKIASSPLDYWFHYLRPDRDEYVPDEKQIFETALRCAILTPKLFFEKYARQPRIFDGRIQVDKAEKLAFLNIVESNNQIPLGYDSKGNSRYDTILEMRAAMLKHPNYEKIFGKGQVGQPTRFEEQNTGAIIKFQPHFISGDAIINITPMPTPYFPFKPWSFQNEAWTNRWDKKAALQMDGAGAYGFVFVNIEQQAPFKVSLNMLDEQKSVAFGKQEYVRNCETYVECLEKNKWPGINKDVTVESLPEWVFKR